MGDKRKRSVVWILVGALPLYVAAYWTCMVRNRPAQDDAGNIVLQVGNSPHKARGIDASVVRRPKSCQSLLLPMRLLLETVRSFTTVAGPRFVMGT